MHRLIPTVTLALVPTIALLTGCTGKTSTADTAGGERAAEASAEPQEVPIVSGTVTETMNAAGYTYILVDTGQEEVWAAGTQLDVAVGDRVSFSQEMPMQDFHSASLDRDFPLIYFSSSIMREGEPTSGQPRGSMTSVPSSVPAGGHPPVDGAEKAVEGGSITPPADGMTVAEVWAERSSVAGQEVTVRGKVVKFNGGILDRNWIHIQDGSGDASDGTHDLTVTSDDSVQVGDVVTVTGTITVDRDFGMGYQYPVLLEASQIER
jgi:hypothetical protein